MVENMRVNKVEFRKGLKLQSQLVQKQKIIVYNIEQSPIAMQLRTNILRIKAKPNCYCYQAHFNAELSPQDALEVEAYIETLDHNIIYVHPLLYANQPITVQLLQVLLSTGESVAMKMELVGEPALLDILDHICQKMLRSLSFLEYRKIKTYFNPFEQISNTIPGLCMEPVLDQLYTGIAILPVNLVLEPPTQISSAKILLNYSNGTFYDIGDIVRVDKQKNLLHFRNGESVSIGSLRKGKLKEVAGLALAERMRAYYSRIKDVCGQLLDNWGIGLEANFFSSSASLISVGGIVLRQGKEKSLSETVSPMARNTYNNNFRQLFRQCALEQSMAAKLAIISPGQLSKCGKSIQHQLQKLSQRMGLKLQVSHSNFPSLQQREQLHNLIISMVTFKGCICILLAPKQPTPTEQENITYFKQQMLNNEMYFHIIGFDQEQEVDEPDIVAIRNLAVLYCKMRMTPWKIKNIPFGEKPLVVCNANVQETADGRYSVAMVLSMNAFLSKFCCYQLVCQSGDITQTIIQLLRAGLDKFCSIHNIYPFRCFIFRTGASLTAPEKQCNEVRTKLLENKRVRTALSYVHLRQDHSIRTFIQTDENYVSKLTVKKTQLLLCTVLSGRYYVQLEFDEPPTELLICCQESDPTFMPKVLELTAKLCYGSVGNEFGKGTGFLSYAAKLNAYKQFDLKKWQQPLIDGVMFFL